MPAPETVPHYYRHLTVRDFHSLLLCPVYESRCCKKKSVWYALSSYSLSLFSIHINIYDSSRLLSAGNKVIFYVFILLSAICPHTRTNPGGTIFPIIAKVFQKDPITVAIQGFCGFRSRFRDVIYFYACPDLCSRKPYANLREKKAHLAMIIFTKSMDIEKAVSLRTQ